MSVVRALACVLALALGGCARGPGEADLRREVEARMAGALPQGTVEMVRFARRGSQRDAGAAPGEERRVIYFDADLRLARDYDFGAWDAPDVAGLVGALGAGPRGLQGVESGGNRRGDIVRARGTLIYERRADAWIARAPQAFGPVTAPVLANDGQGGLDTLVEGIRGTMARVPVDASPVLREALAQELRDAYAAVQARIARNERGYAIAAGPAGGQYLRLVQAFAAHPGSRIVPLVTAGGEENLRLLREGRVDLALSQGDAVLAAYRGEGPYADAGPSPHLRAIGSLYPEAVHVVVRGDFTGQTPSALRGLRVAIGGGGAAARATALAVLAAHGLGEGDCALAGYELGAGLVALREGAVDAVLTVTGVPADAVRVAATRFPLRLLDLEPTAIAAMVDANPAYLRFTIPAAAYPGAAGARRTLATPAVLLARDDLSDAEIATITRALYAGERDLVARGSSQGALVAPANARLGLPVPQHKAALATLAVLGGAAER
jgi:TRAP transporter TAXI family solute receptor